MALTAITYAKPFAPWSTAPRYIKKRKPPGAVSWKPPGARVSSMAPEIDDGSLAIVSDV